LFITTCIEKHRIRPLRLDYLLYTNSAIGLPALLVHTDHSEECQACNLWPTYCDIQIILVALIKHNCNIVKTHTCDEITIYTATGPPRSSSQAITPCTPFRLVLEY